MTIGRLAPAALMMLSACHSNDKAATGQTGGGGGNRVYDVAGVRIGMSLDAARGALAAKGFETYTALGQRSRGWPNAVAAAVAEAQGGRAPPFDGQGWREFWMRKGGTKVALMSIAPGPAGGVVGYVGLTAPTASSPFAQAKADAIAKYGPPTETGPHGDLTWCSSKGCRPSTEVEPWLSLTEGGGTYSLDLNGGSADKAAADKVLADAVAAKIGGGGKSEF